MAKSKIIGAAALAVAVALAWLATRTPDAAGALASELHGEAAARPPAEAELEAPAPREVAAQPVPAPPEPVAAERHFHGKVTDPSDDPVEGALLEIKLKRGNYWETSALGQATSNAEGRFTVSIPAASLDAAEQPETGEVFVCQVTAWGHSQSVDPVHPDEEIQLRVPWTTTLAGVVRDAETGAPIAAAKVQCGSTDGLSDGTGAYRFDAVPVGRAPSIRANKSGYVEYRATALIADRDEERLDLELERGIGVTCRVQDIEDGTPIPDAIVRTRKYGEPLAVADGNGELTFRVAEDDFSVQVVAEGFCVLRWYADGRTLGDGPFVVPLQRMGHIELHARNAEGEPLEDPRGYAYCEEHPFEQHPVPDGLPGRAHWSVPREGANGPPADPAIPVVPCSTPYDVHVMVDGYASVDAKLLVDVPGQRARVDVTLVRGGTVRGTVLRNGEPWSAEGGDIFMRYVDGSFGGRVSIGEDGRYEATSVRPGRIELSLRQSSRRLVEDIWIDVADGEEVEQDIVIDVATGTISGRVTSSDGQPLADVRVAASASGPDGYRYFPTRTGEDGTYSLEVESDLAYEVRAWCEPVSPGQSDVAPGSRNVDFTLPAIGEVTLQLVDAETREPVPIGFEVHVFNWRQHGDRAFRDMQSGHRISAEHTFPMPVGVVDVKVHWADGGYLPAVVTGIAVREAPGDPVEVLLIRGVEATFRFVGDAEEVPAREHGRWWQGHLLFALEQSQLGQVDGPFPAQGGPSNHRINGVNVWIESASLMQQMVHPGEQGLAYVQGLPAGIFSIVSIPDTFVFEPASFELTPDTQGPIEVRWRRR